MVGHSQTHDSTLTETRSEHKLDRPRMWRVLLHNDDYTTQEFVVWVLETIFRKPSAEAFDIMMSVHQSGVGVAGIYTTANEDFFALGGGGEELLPGYQVGVGIETAINETMTLGVEGLYTAATDSLGTENTQLGQVELQPSLLTGKVTLNFRF